MQNMLKSQTCLVWKLGLLISINRMKMHEKDNILARCFDQFLHHRHWRLFFRHKNALWLGSNEAKNELVWSIYTIIMRYCKSPISNYGTLQYLQNNRVAHICINNGYVQKSLRGDTKWEHNRRKSAFFSWRNREKTMWREDSPNARTH